MKLLDVKKYLLWIAATVAVFFLYRTAFSSYFFQDDWFSFQISTASNLGDIARFFMPQQNLIYYRPLGMQLPFFLVKTLFGINPIPFRIATLLVHICAGYVLFQILKEFRFRSLIAFFGSLVYLFSATLFTVFFWAATFAFALAPLFYFAAFLTFIRNKHRISIGLFILGLLVNEMLVTLPGVLIVYVFFNKEKKWLAKVAPYFLLSLVYAGFRYLFARPTNAESYDFISRPQELFINLRNFSLWAFNWPEEIRGQFLSFFHVNPAFFLSFPDIVYLQTITSILFSAVIVAGIVFGIGRQKYVSNYVLGICWFVGSLVPVIFFAHHAYTYYVPIGLAGIIIVLCSSLEVLGEKLKASYFLALLGCLLIFWFCASSQTIQKNLLIHWAPQRAIRSQTLTQIVTKSYPHIPRNSVIIVDRESEKKWALSDQSAFQVLYQDPTLETYYGTLEEYQISNPDSTKTVIQ